MATPAEERLSVVVPIWNEEETIQVTVDVAREALDALVDER